MTSLLLQHDRTATAWAAEKIRHLFSLSVIGFFAISLLVWMIVGEVLFASWFWSLEVGVIVLLVLAVVWATTLGWSYLFGRTRPCFEKGGTSLFPLLVATPSFPSGHSALSVATGVIGLYVFGPYVGACLILLAILVMVGRVGSGVHYLADTFVGAAWGGVCAAVLLPYLLCFVLG